MATTAPGGTPPTDPNSKSPLDILQDLLDKSGGEGGTATPDPKAEEEAHQAELARIAALAAQQAELDAQALQVQLAAIKAEASSPAHQAQVDQDSKATQDHQQHVDSQQGYDIVQIEHTKV